MKLAPESKLITCVLPHGHAMPVIRMLKSEFGLLTANVNHARGSGRLTPLAYRGAGEQTEKEIVTVVVSAQQADTVFTAIYKAAEIDRPHGGLMFQSPLHSASVYQVPEDLPEEG